ncbi:hypothetical protein [Robinsoniella sp.]|uniref:hypothetical protein n=1 Tax=Robinsoniella sp. TaxID=2496533 RepID=UPI003750684C
MDTNNKQYHLSRMRVYFKMLLFAMCLTMSALFCSTYNQYELSDNATVIETWAISECIIAHDDGDHNSYFKTLCLNKNNSYNELITKNTSSILPIAAFQKGNSLFLFLIIVFLLFFLTLFILLPDGWTLINQKVRLDN